MNNEHGDRPSQEFKRHCEKGEDDLDEYVAGVKHSNSPSTMPHRSKIRSIVLVATVAFGMVVNSSNNTSVSISTPTIGQELHLETPQLQWLISAYSLTSGCLLVVFGRLADLHGRKKTFLGGMAWLVAFTLGCGFANDITTLNILRGLQGCGAAAAIPASLGILAHAFPPGPARSLAFATFAAGAPVGAIFGSALGGALTQYTAKSWRSPFYFQTGMSLLCFIGGLISIDSDTLDTHLDRRSGPEVKMDRRVDWIGAFLVTAGLVLVVFVLGQGEIAPKKWATPYIIALLILGVIFIVLFLLWQHRLENIHSQDTPPPMTFLYYQDYMHYTAMQTVIRLLPMFISGILCNVFVGVMAAKVPMVYLMVIGTLGTSTACLLFAVIVPRATYWAFGFPSTVISVIGADFVFAAGTLFIAKVALPGEQSLAGAVFQTMTQLGTAVGVTVTTVVFNHVTTNHKGQDLLKSYQAAQWGCFAFGCIAVILAATSFRGVGVVGHKKMKKTS